MKPFGSIDAAFVVGIAASLVVFAAPLSLDLIARAHTGAEAPEKPARTDGLSRSRKFRHAVAFDELAIREHLNLKVTARL